MCMRAHEDQLSSGCQSTLHRVAERLRNNVDRVAEACWSEIKAQCGDAGKIGQCLERKRGSLSSTCQTIVGAVERRLQDRTPVVGMSVYSSDNKNIGQVVEDRSRARRQSPVHPGRHRPCAWPWHEGGYHYGREARATARDQGAVVRCGGTVPCRRQKGVEPALVGTARRNKPTGSPRPDAMVYAQAKVRHARERAGLRLARDLGCVRPYGMTKLGDGELAKTRPESAVRAPNF